MSTGAAVCVYRRYRSHTAFLPGTYDVVYAIGKRPYYHFGAMTQHQGLCGNARLVSIFESNSLKFEGLYIGTGRSCHKQSMHASSDGLEVRSQGLPHESTDAYALRPSPLTSILESLMATKSW